MKGSIWRTRRAPWWALWMVAILAVVVGGVLGTSSWLGAAAGAYIILYALHVVGATASDLPVPRPPFQGMALSLRHIARAVRQERE